MSLGAALEFTLLAKLWPLLSQLESYRCPRQGGSWTPQRNLSLVLSVQQKILQSLWQGVTAHTAGQSLLMADLAAPSLHWL